jgi:hypothetical protein
VNSFTPKLVLSYCRMRGLGGAPVMNAGRMKHFFIIGHTHYSRLSSDVNKASSIKAKAG